MLTTVSEQWRSFVVVMGRFSRMFSLVSRVNRLVIPVHRYIGLSYILQFIASVVLMNANFDLFMWKTPLWFSLSLAGTLQAISASWYFRYTTPKKTDPGFMSMGDVGRLSWFFVVENIFFSMLLLFQNSYFHPAVFSWGRGAERGTVTSVLFTVIEAMFVFLPYLWRPLFPKTALRDSNRIRAEGKNTDPSNVDFYSKNTVVVKIFYNFAKHYMGFFLNYAQFMGRVAPMGAGHKYIYLADLNGGYMATGGLFIHTMVFKNIVSNKAGAMLYQAGYPGTVYLYYKMFTEVIFPNLDLAILTFIGLSLNFVPNLRYFHAYQAALMFVCFSWRASFQGLESNVFTVSNVVRFAEDMRSQAAAQPALAASVGAAALAAVLVAHRVPKLALAVNPFYKAARRLKKERPHPEDDPEEKEE